MRRLNVTEGSISSLHYLRLMLMPLKLFRGFEAVLEEFILVGWGWKEGIMATDLDVWDVRDGFCSNISFSFQVYCKY